MPANRSISLRVEVPHNVRDKILAELTDEVMQPLRATLTDADIQKLKALFGDDITTISVGSLHAESGASRAAGLSPIVMTAGGGGGYAARLWSKATCA